MKNILSTLILLTTLFLSTVYSQEIVPLEDRYGNPFSTQQTNAVYYKDVNHYLDKYVGEWEYFDGTNYLKINIRKRTNLPVGIPGVFNSPDYEDTLFIHLLFKQNNTIIYDSSRMKGNFIKDPNTINLVYHEPSILSCYRSRKSDLILKVIHHNDPSIPNQLIWTRKLISSTPELLFKCPDGSEYDNSDYLIPANLVLTKI